MPHRFILRDVPGFALLVLLFIQIQSGLAQNYAWPTNASRLMTSSFCEFRPRHYHAAIDIKTWNRTGYKVFAIDDGYVMRVRVGAFGYGKAIYLKLHDGNIVVYGHLERFWPALEKYVTEIRNREQRYEVDLYLKSNQFPVKKGELIAYSGKTGIGVPHLHFELRNPRNHPINPLPFYRDVIKDDVPPKIYNAAFIPLDYASLINLKPDTVFQDLKGRSQCDIPDTLLFTGKIGVALQVYDHANGYRNRFAFYKAHMWVDDSLVYSIQYDSFSYAQTALIELDKNFSLWRKKDGIFHNFFKLPGNRLPHYRNTPDNGGILDCGQLKEGLHHLKIEIEDFWGNQSTFDMNFRSGQPAHLEYDLSRWIDNDLFLRIQSSRKLDSLVVDSRDSGNWSPARGTRLMGELHYNNVYQYAISVPYSENRSTSVFRITGITPSGNSTFPLYIMPSGSLSPLPDNSGLTLLQSQVKKDWVGLTIRSNQRKPFRIFRGLKEQVPALYWFPVSESIYCINIPAEEYVIRKDFLSQFFESALPEIKVIRPNRKNALISADSLFQVDFPVDALYEETAVYLKKDQNDENILPIEKPYCRIGKIYDLQPFDQPVHDGVWIALAVPDSLKNAPGLGLYYFDFPKKWVFIPSQYDQQQHRFSARVTSMEKFTLAQDTIPPVVLPAQPFKNGILQSRKGFLTFVVKDEMSGIQKESQIEVYVNDRWHLFEYDPEEDIISLKIAKNGDQYSHLKIKVTDNSGNVTQREIRVN
ncbi:MAG: M23 family metallopeptidase [Calditrichia bacterium]